MARLAPAGAGPTYCKPPEPRFRSSAGSRAGCFGRDRRLRSTRLVACGVPPSVHKRAGWKISHRDHEPSPVTAGSRPVAEGSFFPSRSRWRPDILTMPAPVRPEWCNRFPAQNV